MRATVGFLLVVAFAAVLLGPGCVLHSEQATVAIDMSPDSLASFSTLPPARCEVHMTDSKEFRGHHAQVAGLADFAMLGKYINVGLTFAHIEWWMTPGSTNYTTAALVRTNGVRVWGGLEMAPGDTVQIDWNKSAGFFDRDKTNAVLDVVKGDGVCTLYALADNGGVGYRFIVRDPSMVLILDAAN